MPDIAAPSPRRARTTNILQPSEMLSQDHQHVQGLFPPPIQPLLPLVPRTLMAPPRLLSPISLREAPYIALNSKSPTPCGGPLKRRGTPRASRSARRRLHLPRIDCPLDPFRRPSVFDQLPWITTLDTPQSQESDIADLSQIFLSDDFSSVSHSAPASGPVRRRKTSLRSNPLASAPGSAGDNSASLQLFPFRQSAHDRPASPKTPPPRIPFDPKHVTFHNLMPVFPQGPNPDDTSDTP
ncbi:hypothetical protein ID866_5129 [Astraeus odoratus]|nr:hypothetical protein ID866_5129 [Astraeus odoratus]